MKILNHEEARGVIMRKTMAGAGTASDIGEERAIFRIPQASSIQHSKKHQNPNTKHQRNLKFQPPIQTNPGRSCKIVANRAFHPAQSELFKVIQGERAVSILDTRFWKLGFYARIQPNPS